MGGVTLQACGGDTCQDTDRDGFGAHCAAGADCDDSDATRNVDCSGPPTDCNATPFAPGCPCLFGLQHECFDGDPTLAGVGRCALGFQQCGTAGQWSTCFESVGPELETCNDVDDDCDGVIDDGVRSPCGGCDPECIGGVWGESEAPFEGDSPLALTARGELTLAYADFAADTLWVTNTGEDTVSRIDTDGALETARYDSGGHEPSRVALDLQGDAWIANRAFDGQSTVTKIVSDPQRCLDRGLAGIDTSTGPTDVKPRGQDDCVVLTVPVGGLNGVARALAIDGFVGLDDAPGRVWVGLQNEQRLVVLDAESGAQVRSIETPGFSPFDAAFDRWGVLWLIDRDGHLGRLIDHGDSATFDSIEVPLSCWQLDGMAIDPDGRITLSGFYCDHVLLFDPSSQRFQVVRNVTSARGVAADAERSYVVHTYGELSVLSRTPWRLESTHSLADDDHAPIETVGAAIDGHGKVWAVSTLGGLSDTGLVTRFDPAAEQVTAQVDVGRLPYAAGDLTGLSRTQVIAPEGTASHVFSGCSSGFATRWLRLHVQWLPGVGSRLNVRARHAASAVDLDTATFIDLGMLEAQGAPIPLSFPDGGAVDVELTLIAGSRLGAPRVARVGLEWDCGGLE